MANPSLFRHSQIRIRISTHLLLFLFLTNFVSVCLSYSTSLTPLVSSSIPYSKYCDSIVPKATPNGFQTSKSTFPGLNSGYFTGGNKILAQNPNFSNDSSKAFVFRTQRFTSTDSEGVVMVEGSLILRVENLFSVSSNYTLPQSKPSRFRTRAHRFPFQRNRLSFRMNGYWSESSGKLCMVGSGTGYSKEGNSLALSGVFAINFPKNSTIFTSWIKGSLESVDSSDSANYFEPISLFSYSQVNYQYTLISEVNESGFSEKSDVGKNSRLGLLLEGNVCSRLSSSSGYELVYESDCFFTKNCSPLGSSKAVLPEMIFFREVQCSGNGKFRLLIGFSKTTYTYYNQPLVLDRMLVGEGVWNGDKNQLNVVACRVLNYTDSLASASIGDCSIRLSMWFPAVMSITSRSRLSGQMWTNKTSSESGYFARIAFQSPKNRLSVFQGMKYEYTKIDAVKKSCQKESAPRSGRRYPSGYSYDMRFDLKVRNKRAGHAWGYAVPLTVGNQFYERGMDVVVLDSIDMAPKASAQMNESSSSSFLNVSYSIRLTPDYQVSGVSSPNMSLNLDSPVEISAEGVYNTKSGHLCMVGCRPVTSPHNHSSDCEIVINVQFPSLNSKSTESVKGTIASTRAISDPLYFENLELSAISLSRTQVKESIWRMDFEITMVLISNTLICIFVGLQIIYVKKHPDVLPSTSLVMLTILTLGQMIPLVLNFEALFLTNRNRHRMTGGAGWLEVNEVLVRVVTMVSFLLQFRLLQLTWSSRQGDGNQKSYIISEKKALYVLLPLYLVGAFIAWAIHWRNNSHESIRLQNVYYTHHSHSIWGDLRSYAGLLLDCFLLPQILFNLFSNSKDKALHPAFYLGITSVHLLPHAYDLYRAYRYVPYYDAAYIYASPGGDFYSTAWDVVIPFGGLLFAILIFLQQRFGGCCILPPRFRQVAAYEKVPVAIGESL